MGEQSVQQRALRKPLGNTCVRCRCEGDDIANLYHLWSICQEFQYPVVQGSIDVQITELPDQPEWNYGVERGAVVDEQHLQVLVLWSRKERAVCLWISLACR